MLALSAFAQLKVISELVASAAAKDSGMAAMKPHVVVDLRSDLIDTEKRVASYSEYVLRQSRGTAFDQAEADDVSAVLGPRSIIYGRPRFCAMVLEEYLRLDPATPAANRAENAASTWESVLNAATEAGAPLRWPDDPTAITVGGSTLQDVAIDLLVDYELCGEGVIKTDEELRLVEAGIGYADKGAFGGRVIVRDSALLG